MDTFNRLLERVFVNIYQQDQTVVPQIRAVYARIHDLLGEEAPNLQDQQSTKLGIILEKGSQLAGIGQLIGQVFS